MRRVCEPRTFGMVAAVAALVVGFGSWRTEVSPARADLVPTAMATGGLIAHFQEDDVAHRTRVVVVDPTTRRMAVYDIDGNSGGIQLKSVRNLTIDLQVQEFNSGEPSPVDMQKTLQRN